MRLYMIGDKIKLLRRKRKLTQSQLANELNVTAQAVSKWEKGLSYPDIETIIKISEFFGVTTDYLLKD